MRSKKAYQSEYSFTKGVDLVSSADEVNPARSPDAINVIFAKNGYMDKRPGYKTVLSFKDRINGIFYLDSGGQKMIVVHSGRTIYRVVQSDEITELMSDVADNKSSGFCLGQKLYILTGEEYIYYDGSTCDHVKSIATVPTYMIACKPNGNGVYYQSPNFLQPKRLVKFSGDASSTNFQLPEKGIASVDTVLIDGKPYTDFSVDVNDGIVRFYTAPPAPKTPGEDNVDITYTKLIADNQMKIERCRISTLYGIGANDRAIVGGNPYFYGKDWISELRDPTYFPYELESEVGGDTTPIMGYGKLGDKLCIAKKSAGGESTIFFRTGAMIEGRAIFSTKQSIVGVGMACIGRMGSIDDEPMFLSENGIYGITTSSLTAESTVQNRSYFINPALVSEKNLDEANIISLGGRLYLAVDSRVYILDGSLGRTVLSGSGVDYVYECFIWDDIPVRVWFNVDDKLYFGTDDGKICVFKDRSYADEYFNDDGRPIVAHISTKADSDGNYAITKQLERRGLFLRLKGNNNTGITAQIRVDYADAKEIYDFTRIGTDFVGIDFSNCGFAGIADTYALPITAKCKNYGTLQVILKNDKLNQGLGLLGIIKKFSYRRGVRKI